MSLVYCTIAILNLILFLLERDLKLFVDTIFFDKENNTFQFNFLQKIKAEIKFKSNEFFVESKGAIFLI